MRINDFDEVDLTSYYAYPSGPAPWLRANMISSVDGAAWHDGKTGGLGSPADQALLALLRGLSDVVVVGANTVRAEGYGPIRPRDAWRDIRAGRTPAPALAIVSRDLDLDVDAPVFTEGETIVITCEASPADRRRAAGKRAEVIIAGGDRVDVVAALDALAGLGHTRQLSEGGPRLLTQFAAAGRVDELCLTLSPRLAAGDAGRIMSGPMPPTPERLRLGHVLEHEDFLFLRYVKV